MIANGPAAIILTGMRGIGTRATMNRIDGVIVDVNRLICRSR
jgi:hypothetical protein